MKNKTSLVSVFIAASSFSTAEIVVNDFLSFEGFIDMSYSHYDADVDASVDGIGSVFDASESDNAFGIDQVEISWLFDFEPVTAQIDLEHDSEGDDDIVEQAFASYHFDFGGALTAGLYYSMLGFEASEPTGLYQYSLAYGFPNGALDFLSFSPVPLPPLPNVIDVAIDDVIGAVGATIFPLPGYSQGVKFTLEGDNTFFGASVQDGLYAYGDRFGGDSGVDGGGFGVEIAGAYYMDNGLSFFLGGAFEDGDGYSIAGLSTGDTEAWVLNTYATFEIGSWLFAAEVVYGENEWNDTFLPSLDIETESLSGLLMANFAYSEKASVTGRLSYVDYEIDGGVSGLGSGYIELDMFKYTVAHNYAFTDNLLLVAEVSYSDGDVDASIGDNVAAFGADADFDELLFAVELLFTF